MASYRRQDRLEHLPMKKREYSSHWYNFITNNFNTELIQISLSFQITLKNICIIYPNIGERNEMLKYKCK